MVDVQACGALEREAAEAARYGVPVRMRLRQPNRPLSSGFNFLAQRNLPGGQEKNPLRSFVGVILLFHSAAAAASAGGGTGPAIEGAAEQSRSALRPPPPPIAHRAPARPPVTPPIPARRHADAADGAIPFGLNRPSSPGGSPLPSGSARSPDNLRPKPRGGPFPLGKAPVSCRKPARARMEDTYRGP